MHEINTAHGTVLHSKRIVKVATVERMGRICMHVAPKSSFRYQPYTFSSIKANNCFSTHSQLSKNFTSGKPLPLIEGRDYFRYQPYDWKLETYQKIVNLRQTSIERDTEIYLSQICVST